MTRKLLAAFAASFRRFQARSATGQERLWKVWWFAGIPVGWATSALVLYAECLRSAGHDNWGDALDVVRLLVYFAWFRLAWRCSRNVDSPWWTPLAQGALAAGLALAVML